MFEDAMIAEFSQEKICKSFAKQGDVKRSALPSLACGASILLLDFGSPRTAPFPKETTVENSHMVFVPRSFLHASVLLLAGAG